MTPSERPDTETLYDRPGEVPVKRTMIVRGWPGASRRRRYRPCDDESPRFSDRVSMVLHVAAADSLPDLFGLGAALIVLGSTVLGGVLILPDDVTPQELDNARKWARRHPVNTVKGPESSQVARLSEWLDPRATVARSPLSFWPRAYASAGFVFGSDLLRSFGLMAEHVVERTSRNAGRWQLWPPGVGERHPDGAVKAVSPNRPPVETNGSFLRFGSCPKGFGKRIAGRIFTGRFVDDTNLGHALDADRSASYGQRLANLRLPDHTLSERLSLGAEGFAAIVADVLSLHGEAIELDRRVSEWFTSPADRREGIGRLDLVTAASPGTMANILLDRLKITPAMDKYAGALSDERMTRWCEAAHGGALTYDRDLLGEIVPVVPSDISSAYPLAFLNVAGTEALTAEHLRCQDVTKQMEQLAVRVLETPDLLVRDPSIGRRVGMTLCEVKPDGEYWPIELEDRTRPDGRFETTRVRSPNRSLFVSGFDYLNAVVLSRRLPNLVSTEKLVPVGRQAGLREDVPCLPGLRVSPENFMVRLAGRRRMMKAKEDVVGAAQLRVMMNAVVWGQPLRFDVEHDKEGRLTERPGPRSFVPLAVAVAGYVRFVLGTLRRRVEDFGGTVVYSDTDSAYLLALPWDTGTRERVGRAVSSFDSLAPSPTWGPVFKTESDCQLVVYGPKRYAKLDADGRVLDCTEAHLPFADPPRMTGRVGMSTRRHWPRAGIARELSSQGPDGPREPAPWDASGESPFPALRRLRASTPTVLHSLPECFGARPGFPFLAVSSGGFGRSFVVPDPGGDLSNWRSLPWHDRRTGEKVAATTEWNDAGRRVPIESLDDRMAAWTRPLLADPVPFVEIDPALVAVKGRVSGVLDAAETGEPGDLADFRPVHAAADGATFVRSELDRLGPAAFVRRYPVPEKTVEGLRGGACPSAKTIARVRAAAEVTPSGRQCALPECSEPVERPNALYCSRAHTAAAARARKRVQDRKRTIEKQIAAGDEVCRDCGTIFLSGLARTRHQCEGGVRE